jgi:hypothetical protein
VTLRMYGDQCQGPPIAVVSIDGSATRSINVDQTSFTDFILPLDSTNGGSAGTHTIKVEFDNNLVTADCDRNIYLDKISFRPVPPIPPAPTGYARSKGATPDLASLVPSFTARMPTAGASRPPSIPRSTRPCHARRQQRTRRSARAAPSTRASMRSCRARCRRAAGRTGSSERSRSTTAAPTASPRPTATRCS